MDDAAGWDTPTVACHAFDGLLVLADRHRRQAAAGEHHVSDARHAVADRYACQIITTQKRLTLDACHAVGNSHTRKSAATRERTIPDFRHIGSDFNRLRIFYPTPVLI